MFIFANVNAEVSYNETTKTLTVIGSTTVEEIRPYSEAIELIIQDASGMNNMAYQYGQTLKNLETLQLPSSITEIPNQTFANCEKLVTVNWGDLVNLKTIGKEAFMNTAIGPEFTVPNSVEEIKNGAFRDCYNIKTLTFSAKSQIKHIYEYAFYMTDEGKSVLSDVYVNCIKEITCDKGAFDKTNTCAQTQAGTVKTRLHYPPEYFEHYVGLYKQKINGGLIIEQNHIDQAYNGAGNGWQQFMSSGIPIGENALYRTYSDNVTYKVPHYNIIQVYLVVDYDKTNNIAKCIQMKQGDEIPARTGVIVHSDVVSTVFLEYSPKVIQPYDNEAAPNNLYHYKGNEYYTNYLKPINGELHIDNVEIVNGIKTYRNYFFNKGTTAANRPGPDWKDEYITYGWGFFRAVSKDYRVFNKAFLHLPASMTDSNSEYIKDNRVLPQDNTQSENNSKNFTMYIINAEDILLSEFGITTNINTYKIINNDYYTLEGIKTKNPTKGIYIKNNRKVVIK